MRAIENVKRCFQLPHFLDLKGPFVSKLAATALSIVFDFILTMWACYKIEFSSSLFV